MDPAEDDVAEPSPVASEEEREELGGDFEEGAALSARDCLVWQLDQAVNFDYLVGAIEVTIGQGDLCAVISIAELHGKLLVAVPEEVWHRTVARRKLPSRTLSKAVLVAVAGCAKQQRSHEEDIIKQMKIWVGLMDPEMESELSFAEEDGLTYHFGSTIGDYLVPYAQALVEVASEHFAFASAESEVPAARQMKKAAKNSVENRLENVEEMLSVIAQNLAKVTGEPGSSAGGSKSARPKTNPKPSVQPVPKIRGLDNASVQAALEAGIPMDHLQEMGKILKSKPTKLEDVPRKKVSLVSGSALDESEEDAEEVEVIREGDGTAADGGPKGVEEAILQLTRIAAKLTGGSSGKKEKMEQLLDGVSGSAGATESSGHPGTRKNAAALRALQRCLREDPKFIFQTLENNLQTDFQGRAVQAGEPMSGNATVRGWLTGRSRIQNYQQHVRWCWSLGGIWDCLIAGQNDEARARCGLLLAAADQASIDQGSWVLSTVGLLEPVPPYQLFNNHSQPTAAEAQHSALYDVRWAELFLSHLKEVDAFSEAKRKLGGRGIPLKDREEEVSARAKAAAAKAKAKGEKGKGKKTPEAGAEA